MNNAKLNVVKFDDNDVIATSACAYWSGNKVVYGGNDYFFMGTDGSDSIQNDSDRRSFYAAFNTDNSTSIDGNSTKVTGYASLYAGWAANDLSGLYIYDKSTNTFVKQ